MGETIITREIREAAKAISDRWGKDKYREGVTLESIAAEVMTALVTVQNEQELQHLRIENSAMQLGIDTLKKEKERFREFANIQLREVSEDRNKLRDQLDRLQKSYEAERAEASRLRDANNQSQKIVSEWCDEYAKARDKLIMADSTIKKLETGLGFYRDATHNQDWGGGRVAVFYWAKNFNSISAWERDHSYTEEKVDWSFADAAFAAMKDSNVYGTVDRSAGKPKECCNGTPQVAYGFSVTPAEVNIKYTNLSDDAPRTKKEIQEAITQLERENERDSHVFALERLELVEAYDKAIE